MPIPVLRFAPSPNGPLHRGHAYSALMNQRVATRLGGTVLLRLEDIDRARCSAALEAGILQDLAWLGFGWSGPVLRQSERFGLYDAALERLRQRSLVYPCFCSRGDIVRAIGAGEGWPPDPDGSPLYPGTCRHLDEAERAGRIAAGRPFAIRLDMARAREAVGRELSWSEFREGEVASQVPARSEAWGDAVLRRKDIPASYHLAVVVDDAAQGMTDIVRGEDLFAATALHRLLQELLGLPTPAYHHHRLILGPDGGKLSKSRHAPSLADDRQAGLTPADIRAAIGLG